MLTTKQIDHAKPGKKAIRLTDSFGLYLEIDPNGGKYWRFRYRYFGKKGDFLLAKTCLLTSSH